MSDTDSFIEEVSEEVRRDRLYGLLRRYGWIAIVAVVVIVGGAAYNEYRKAQIQAAAQSKGDAILAALDTDEGPGAVRDALAALPEDQRSSPVIAMLTASQAVEADDTASAAAALKAVMDDAEQPQIYRDVARLKYVLLTAPETSAADRISALAPLAIPGGPFRPLAEEQIALAELEQGERDAAIARLQALLVDVEASQGLRNRVQQLIVALGATPEPA